MAKPPGGKETCELIHSSVVQRYKWGKAGSFEPFSYRPKNAYTLLDNPQQIIIAELSAFEGTYRPEDLLLSPSAGRFSACPRYSRDRAPASVIWFGATAVALLMP